MAGTPARKVDRDEVFLELTRSICRVCKPVIDAEINARDNRVIMRTRCPEHGLFEALVELLERVAARLKVLAMTAALNPGDLERGSDIAALARDAVTAGTLGYGSLIASRR